MGWTYTRGQTRDELIADLTATRAFERDGRRITRVAIDKSLNGNALWVLFEDRDEHGAVIVRGTGDTVKVERFIALFLLSRKRDYGYGYKDMDESMHPYTFSCPMRFLYAAPVACAAWRAAVEAWHLAQATQRQTKRRLRAGMVIELRNTAHPMRVQIVTVGPKILGRGEDGVLYRISPRHLGRVIDEGNFQPGEGGLGYMQGKGAS